MDGEARASREVAEAYDQVAELYIELFGDEELADPADRDVIVQWAAGCRGPVLDAGCGPGHWSAALARRGVPVDGIDLSAQFLMRARRSCPELTFVQGDLRCLPYENGSRAGVLAWFSLIHFEEKQLRRALKEFHRVLAPGGGLLIGFFLQGGDEPRSFDHKVSPAWAWSSDWLAQELVSAGFLPIHSEERQATESQREQGHWSAVRAPGE
ncbi:class I SAM-dependent methyltransferase [Arthrobacter sp. NPDC090010]|uniref:class I SAM-dependent methyltransferase n=1 Tax=Arthrobacter sp. NPDC090010 TaxID=3363942 RepID=UPI003813584F